MIIAKSYNHALKRFASGFFGEWERSAVANCGISRYNQILVWMQSFTKFIKFLRMLEINFVSGALSIKFHLWKFKIFQPFFKFLNAYSAPFKHHSCIITILFRTEPNLLS